MATSNLEQAAAKLLSAWGDGVAPASNCVAYVNELRKAYAAEVEAKEQARIETYRVRARDLTVCFDPDRAYNEELYEVAADAPVEPATMSGDSGAWVTMRVFIKGVDDDGEF